MFPIAYRADDFSHIKYRAKDERRTSANRLSFAVPSAVFVCLSFPSTLQNWKLCTQIV